MATQSESHLIRSLKEDPQRKREMIGSLKRDLDADTQGQDPTARIGWLFSHLEDYLDRWTSWIRLFSISDFLRHDGHVVLTMGVDLIDEEQRSLFEGDTFKKKWQGFALLVRSINEGTSRNIIDELTKSFAECCDELKRLMTDKSRKERLIKAQCSFLQAHMECQNPISRLESLFSYLDVYLERWILWLAHPYAISGFHLDQHFLATIMIHMIDEVLRDLHCPKEKWQVFATTVSRIGESSGNSIAKELKVMHEAARKELIG